MGHKAVETTSTSTTHLAQELLMNSQCKGDKSLEDERQSSRPSEGDNNQLRVITEADPLTTTEG